jgi:alpha-D-xyloside xylohydrolase
MNTRHTFALLLAAAFSLTPKVSAEVESLRSAALQLEVNTSPYSYRVLEAATGKVILAHSALAFGQKRLAAVSASAVTKTANTMRARLQLAGSSDGAEISFTFTRPEVVQVVVSSGGGEGREVLQEFLDQGEHYYGIWEYPFGGSIDNRGADRDFLGFEGLATVVNANARAPFYIASAGYGVYVETDKKGHYTIARDGKTSFWFEDSSLKYDIIYGRSYADIFQRYNSIAGGSVMPPTWAFDSIWWRDDHHADLRGVKSAQEKVIDDADQLIRRRIPASTIWIDRPYGTGTMGWGNMDFDSSFPDPAKMVQDLKQRGYGLMLWIADRAFNRLAAEGAERGYLFPPSPDPHANGPAADIRNKEACDWWKQKLGEYVKLGVKGWKLDRGEEGEMPESFMNEHAILFARLAAESLQAANKNDFFILSRNADDTSRKYTAIWNGDSHSSFEALAMSVKNAQRCGAINFPMWGSDTGGYIGAPNKELLARWLQFSAYSTVMEVLVGPKRTIWMDYDAELIDIAREQASAHHDLIPYTRSYVYRATQTGMPVMRSLIFAYPDDDGLYDAWDEYLFGGELLVAPVLEAGVTSRDVYLPAGQWLDYNDKTTLYQGGTKVTAQAPLAKIPLFVREGAIIPRGDIWKGNNWWQPNWTERLRIEVFPSSKVAGRFDYYTGTVVQPITVSAGRDGIRVAFPNLGVPGTLEVYCQNVKGVTRNGVQLTEGASGYSYDAATKKLTVRFTGVVNLTIQGATGIFGS